MNELRLPDVVTSLKKSTAVEYFNHVKVEKHAGCVEVTNYSTFATGYPRWRSIKSGKMIPIARDVYEESTKKTLKAHQILVRTCGNRKCCSPAHFQVKSRKGA